MLRELLVSNVGWWAFIVGLVVVSAAAVEVGFRIGRRRLRQADGEVDGSRAGTVLGALLALLGFLLAITFSITEHRFEQRKALVLQEANAIGTTALRADFLPAPHDERVEQWLLRYIDLRLELARDKYTIETARTRSDALQRRIWSAATTAAENNPRSVPIGLFIESFNETIDLQAERLTIGTRYHLPPSLVWTLLFVAMLAMVSLGYYFGLGGERNWQSAGAVVLAFTVVIILIVDLDQPTQRLFAVSQAPLVDSLESIEAQLESDGSSPPSR
jgi:hypothetical protein